MKLLLWLGWAVLTITLLSFFAYKLFLSEDKSNFIVGPATHGHYQIEMACETCHTDSFGGPEILQSACENCHADELTAARDDHPKKKFTNPRNAELLNQIDARQCISCHSEHQKEQTREMGLTIAEDFCYHCHQEVGDNRPSHKDLAFDTCQSAGCHNFHDNRALYENFLVDNANQPWLKQISLLKEANFSHHKAPKPKAEQLADSVAQNLISEKVSNHPDIHQQWSMSAHAGVQVQCTSCHLSQSDATEKPATWVEKPGIESCESCHSQEVAGFTAGKHGMRLSSQLSKTLTPMTPELARLDFHQQAKHQELSCNSCHNVHELNTQVAATESCLSCHAGEHSLAYNDSPHAALWNAELSGEAEQGTGVTCATCHMPRTEGSRFVDKDRTIKEVSVQHNQNATLRPNEKMIRPVCMQCHSLEFSIDSLADETLIKNNFSSKPEKHVESIDWATKRVQ